MNDADKLVERLREILVNEAVDSVENAAFHSWRCRYPDRYGPCSCFDELMKEVRGAVESHFAAHKESAAAQEPQWCDRLTDGRPLTTPKEAAPPTLPKAMTLPEEPKRFRYGSEWAPLSVSAADYDSLRSTCEAALEENKRLRGQIGDLTEATPNNPTWRHVKIGKYFVGPHPAGGYWIEHESGEGMEGGARFEEAIDEYYKANF